MEVSKELLTVQEAADLLRVPVSWVYDRTRRGAIPVRRLGNRLVRIPRQELLDWVDNGCRIGGKK